MSYWAERTAKSQAALTNKTLKQTEKQMKLYYKASMEKTLGNFEKVYNKVFQDMVEGKQVTPADLYKLDTYWQLQGQLKQELEKLGDKQISLLTDKFVKQYQDIYQSIAFSGEAAFNTLDTNAAKQMINSIWCADGKSWSSRIWTNTDKLQQALNDNLIHCVATGKKPSEFKKILQTQFGASYARADSLVRTELAHIQTEAAKQRYIDYGVQQVEIWADEDERRCDICGKLHQKKYSIGEKVPLPAHPNCRCCIIPVVE